MYIHPIVVLALVVVAAFFFVKWLGAGLLVAGLCAIIALLLGGICMFLSNLKVWR
jgi:hypothetical protein